MWLSFFCCSIEPSSRPTEIDRQPALQMPRKENNHKNPFTLTIATLLIFERKTAHLIVVQICLKRQNFIIIIDRSKEK